MKEENIFNIRLLHEIEKYPYLYNYNLTEYTARETTDKAWNEIAEKFKKPPEECKARWKNLRGSLTRNLSQRLKPTGKVPKTFYLTKYMQFVMPFAKTKQVTSKESEDQEEDEVPCYQIKNNALNSDFVSVYSQSQSYSESKKRKITPSGDFKNHGEQDISDEDKYFLNSVYKAIKNVPNHLKLSVQMEIINLIKKAENPGCEPPPFGVVNSSSSQFENNLHKSSEVPLLVVLKTENIQDESGYTYEALSSEGTREGNLFDQNLDDNSNTKEDESRESWDSVDVKNDIEFFDENEESNESNTPQRSNTVNKNNSVPTSSLAATKDPLETRIEQSLGADHNDADKHFLLSLLPHLHGFTTAERLQFQIKTLNVINDIMSAREKV